MKTEQNNLERLKEKNPFFVPQGYMDGLTSQIMNQLPVNPREEAKRISLFERVRPWLYMAAVFAGMGLFFKAIVGEHPKETNVDSSLLVRTEAPTESISVVQTDEDLEYLEYLEDQYADYLFAQEMVDFEIN